MWLFGSCNSEIWYIVLRSDADHLNLFKLLGISLPQKWVVFFNIDAARAFRLVVDRVGSGYENVSPQKRIFHRLEYRQGSKLFFCLVITLVLFSRFACECYIAQINCIQQTTWFYSILRFVFTWRVFTSVNLLVWVTAERDGNLCKLQFADAGQYSVVN